MNSLRLFGLLSLLAFALPAHALRCDSRVVDRGDRDFEVRERCGEPFWIEQFYAFDVQGADGPYERQVETVYDAWYFNFGPRRLMVRLLFRDGVLEREETLGYGVSAIGEGCNPDALTLGTPSGEIVARCGRPSSQRSWNEQIVRRDGRGNEVWRPVRREEWVYAGNRQRLARFLQLRNGRLESVETGRR